MRRREFIAGLGGVAASGACAASRDSQNRCAVARSLAPRFATYGVISADASSWRSTSRQPRRLASTFRPRSSPAPTR